jgi:phenylalanyl-tRNA synthetase beta chain
MKLPIAWLRDYLDVTLTSDELAERFATLGFPVEAIERRPRLSGVVVGRLVRVEKHPDADRLQICTVDVGGERLLTIATAATNVAMGQTVPVATIGAQLVGLTIGPRKMRGIASEGMLCSAAELGLEGAWFEDGILQLESDLAPGTDFVERFHLSDDVLEVEVTANRVDAMSVLGLARELAASFGVAVREPSLAVERYAADPTPAGVVTLESPDCKRFVAQRISGLAVRTAPFWMRVRLALAGQRPIDNLVDISNFVMLEGAQPLHFYDYERLAGQRLVVRDAREGERMQTLDEAERALDPRFLVIADEREPQCIAGLKGAAASEVTAATREILVEAATFAGPRVRRMSVALGLRTEASTRHEKGLPLGLSTWGAARAAHLLEREGAVVHAPAAAGASDAAPPPIDVNGDRFRALLGIDIDASQAGGALRALGFAVRERLGALEVTAPPWRGDVRIPEDVVEEVARIVGYDRIVAQMPAVFEQQVSSGAYRDERRVAHALAAAGYREAVTMSLQPATVAQTYARAGIALGGEVVEIRNPLSEDQRYLRFSLVPGLLAIAARYAGGGPLRVFEIGHVFEGVEPYETSGVAWLAVLPRGDEPAWRDGGFSTFKGESEACLRALCGRAPEAVTGERPGWHPGKTAVLLVGDRDVATVGALDPRLAAAYEIDGRVYAGWMRLADLPAYAVPRYHAPSKYPPISRDLALVVAPHVPAKDIEHAVRAAGNGEVAAVRVFDEYRGPQLRADEKSLAVRVVLQRPDATLTDAEADRLIAAILNSLEERCGARLRS